jgi:hypothetical protein
VGSSAPLANLADFLKNMREQGYSEEDVRQVEVLALKVLASLSSTDETE